mmetsp:Transcript_35655/g.112479  ORF Transcript_35655/g.112479 Transcript_35655/m.112479 type:complete len:200 (-) Transcript_35655:474-1073(-)
MPNFWEILAAGFSSTISLMMSALKKRLQIPVAPPVLPMLSFMRALSEMPTTSPTRRSSSESFLHTSYSTLYGSLSTLMVGGVRRNSVCRSVDMTNCRRACSSSSCMRIASSGIICDANAARPKVVGSHSGGFHKMNLFSLRYLIAALAAFDTSLPSSLVADRSVTLMKRATSCPLGRHAGSRRIIARSKTCGGGLRRAW